MDKKYLKDLPVFQFHILQKFSDQVKHAVFTRHGGVSKPPYDKLNVRFGVGDDFKNVETNRLLISDALGVKSENLVSANQTHSKNVAIADEEFLNLNRGKEVDNFDAFITNMHDVALMVQVADCQPILMFDPVKKVIAAVHAGWKGLVQNISCETINLMQKKYGCLPENILVGIGPSLGPDFAFFSEPENELPTSFANYIDKKKRVNLWQYSVDQLVSCGIARNHIELAGICTQEEKGKNFYSYRGEKGITGRFGAVILMI
ncbi:peptidoglycan editing factor PgeF [Candidatus Peregrinibacteria bacterium]|nr:peptidoglycan editing factor PgeF [Candidatus Peregrinibacteria bacterium]